jgi:hypothetical protein
MKGERYRRQVARTVLVVGEGDAEVCFLQHLKALYVLRGSGVVVTIKNARGKGAAHVVDFAVRQSRNAAYDLVVALLDTDADWNDQTRAAARKGRVEIAPCQPCLEAVLLSVHRAPVQGRSTLQLKHDFEARFGGAAHEAAVWRHFNRDALDAALPRVAVLRSLRQVLLAAEWFPTD